MANKDPSLTQVYKSEFVDSCLGGQCEDAVQNLISSLDGNSGLFGCDLMQIIYQGDVNGHFYMGYRDMVASRSAYILTLINVGINVVSTYRTMTATPKDAPTAWKSV